jgi:Tfp pilus assembly protein PilO
MKVSHAISASVDLPLSCREAVAFVQSVRSLSRVRFMQNLQVSPQADGISQRLRAEIPVDVPLLGHYDLTFASELVPTARGASLQALPVSGRKGWAQVSGEAEVAALPGGSRVRYLLAVTLHVDLPEPERWGGRALLKMVELTAQRVVADITAEFPKAVEAAAADAEGVLSGAYVGKR